ncbi:MAG: TetR/AcrR family transcriptional regulator [Solirubrobacterales bacterium]
MNEKLQKTDRRVRRTKRILAVTLVDLLKEKPLNRITVKEITEIADVNRATFYRHYQDVYDMFHQVEDDLLAEFKKAVTAQPVRGLDDLRGFYVRIFEFVGENADFGQMLAGTNREMSLVEKCKDIVDDFLNDARTNNLPPVDRFANAFVVAGFVEVVKTWLNENMPVPPARMAEYILHSIRFGFASDSNHVKGP